MRLPADPYFSDSEIALETRPRVSGPDGLSKAKPTVWPWLFKMLGMAIGLSTVLAMAACWLDRMG